jgi:Fur family ferric uptake transcriptional regulator
MSSQATTTFKRILQDSDYSFTKPRRVVLELLLNADALSTSEIIDRLDEKIDRASIYRTLNLFEELAIIQRINYGWKHKFELSDKFRDHHHHLICLNCGSFTSINETEIEKFLDLSAKDQGFIPKTHQVEVQGYCKNCKHLFAA